MTEGEKALTLAYGHCELLKKNLEVAILELRIANDPRHKRVEQKLVRLRAASNATFSSLIKMIDDRGEALQLEQEIEDIMTQTWTEDDSTN